MFKLVLRHLVSRRLRSLLTLASISIAIFLLCGLRTVVSSLQSAVDSSANNRLIVQSAVSLFVNLPLAYQSKIDGVEGVDSTCKFQWFGGYYQDPSNFFAQFAVDPERLFPTYPEAKLTEGSMDEFLQTRTACVVGRALVEDFPEFQIGSDVPIESPLFPRPDGTPWMFTIAGIYESTSPSVDERTLYFHFKYLEESLRAAGADGDMGVSVYSILVDPGTPAEQVMADVDALYEEGPQRVQTTTESEFNRQFVSMYGNVPTFLSVIGGSVVFAILLAVLNTMLMAARERRKEFGILKALGFSDRKVSMTIFGESLLLCGSGGAIGVWLMHALSSNLPPMVASFFPNFRMTGETVLLGIGGALLIGLIAAVVPAWQANRLRPVEAFRAEG